jgi:hypothetical protein
MPFGSSANGPVTSTVISPTEYGNKTHDRTGQA